MNRRNFSGLITKSALLMTLGTGLPFPKSPNRVKFGSKLVEKFDSPEQWINIIKSLNFTAADSPLAPGVTDSDLIRAYRETAAKNDIIISEVGAWSNTISPETTTRKNAIEKCVNGLYLAEELGANCCVNISGSRNPEHWAGPHPDNLSQDTFDLVVETVRQIIDQVRPKNTYFTLEMMPWSIPESIDTYEKLLKAVARPQFAVHLDPVNLINSIEKYFKNADLIRECFTRLGPHIKSCHAKDVHLQEDVYMPNIREVRPGTGSLNYQVYLKSLSQLKDIPLIMEHLPDRNQYNMAANYIRQQAKQANLSI